MAGKEYFFMTLPSYLIIVYNRFKDKKEGILIKKESESLEFTGLEISRDYFKGRGLK